MEYTKEIIKQHANICALLDAAGQPMHGASSVMLDQLLKRIAELEKDAARYRWLREQPDDCSVPRIDICYWTCEDGDSVNTGEGLRLEAADKAIDTAMQKD